MAERRSISSANPNIEDVATLAGECGFAANADRWPLELFIENLANSRGLTNKNCYPYSLAAMTQMEVVTPRTIGVDLSVKF